MDHKELRDWSKRAADWAHDYHEGLRARPVRAALTRGAVSANLPERPPEHPETMDAIFADFERIVPDAMTHWQHPRFFAYFPANAAPASMLAEQLVNAMGCNALLWQTSPAATEVEERMVDWLRIALGLGDRFSGVIHDSATTATLSALLTMRERALDWRGNDEGLSGQGVLRLYASDQTHSSVDKSAMIAGFGRAGLVKVATGAGFGMDPHALDAAIRGDLSAGRVPAGVVLCVGGTGIGACDPLAECIAVARAHGLPVHVDAAWAGAAMICPELRALWDGVDGADSVVVNPHKWLGAQFDCSVQFLADPGAQIRTLGLRPDYLQTDGVGEIVNFNEWTVPLGRRFRALKLWFVLRAHGLEGLRAMIRDHISWSTELCSALADLPGIEIVTPPMLSLFTFRLRAGDSADEDARASDRADEDARASDRATETLLSAINDDGRVFLTRTLHQGRPVIRVQVGSFHSARDDVMLVRDVVAELSQLATRGDISGTD